MQLHIIHELQDNMRGCSTAFVAVAAAGIALSVAASSGVTLEEAPEVLFNGVTVGDVASWVDSLLVAALLRFGADSFARVEEPRNSDRQLAYTFQVGCWAAHVTAHTRVVVRGWCSRV